MENCFSLAMLLVFGLVAVGTSVSVQELKRNLKLRGILAQMIELSNRIYLWDNTANNYQDAENLCKLFDGNADLAIMEGRNTFNDLRFTDELPTGSYWINGKEKSSASGDPTQQYNDLNLNCKPLETAYSLAGINLRQSATPTNCLLFVKGSNSLNSYIQPSPCTGKFKSLCSMPKDATICIPPNPGP